jgi:hypothetical protein
MELELHQLDWRYEALRTRSARRERRLLAALSEVGQQTPIVVVRDGERWVVVDGYKRVRALPRLGQDVVRAAEWMLSELEALVLERVMRASDGDSAIEQGWLLRERAALRSGAGRTRAAFRSEHELGGRRLGLVTDLPASVQGAGAGGCDRRAPGDSRKRRDEPRGGAEARARQVAARARGAPLVPRGS